MTQMCLGRGIGAFFIDMIFSRELVWPELYGGNVIVSWFLECAYLREEYHLIPSFYDKNT